MATRRVRTEFDANTAQFDRGVQRMNREMQRFRRGTESRLDRIDRRFQRSARAVGRLRNAIGALVAVAGVRRLAGSFDRVLTRLDAIGKASDRLGIGVEALQELRFAAEQSGIAVNTFDTAMQRFTRRVAEAASGTGEAKAALEELGVQLRDSNGVLRPTEDLLFDVADALRDVEAQGDRVRLGFKLFDSEGLRVIQMLQEGSENLRRMREEARELGVVMSEDMVRDATRMKDEMARQIAALDALWTQFVVRFLRGADRLFSFVPSTVGEQLAERVEELRSVQNALAAGPGVMRGPLDTGGTAGLRERESQLLSEIRTLEELRQAQQGVNDAIREAETAGGLAGLSGGGGGGGAASAAAERTRETTAAIEEQGRALDDKAVADDRAAEAARRHAEAQARIERAVQQVSDAILGAIESADSFSEALENVAIALARIAAQQLSQPGGGFLGQIFRGIFSAGLSSTVPGNSGLGALYHRGGVVGRTPVPMREVPPWVFSGAPRMHSGGIAGLRPNEVPAILERGEIVVPKNIGMGRASSVTVGDTILNITQPNMDEAQLRRVLADHRRQILRDITEMNERDPEWLHT